MKITTHKAISKVVEGETIYMIPIPNFYKPRDGVRFKDNTMYKVGVYGWEKYGAITIEYDLDTALYVFSKLNELWISRLAKNYQKFRDAENWFNSDFTVLHINSPTEQEKKQNLKLWNRLN